MKYKNQEPAPKPKSPRHYRGVENNFPSLRTWEILKFSNSWISKPLVNQFHAEVVSIMARLREKQRAA